MSAPRFAVVTGANKGIGYFIAKGLAERGYTVFLACRNPALAAAAAVQLASQTARPVEAFPVVALDLSAGARSAKPAADEVLSRLGGPNLEILVNNAGLAFGNDAKEPFGSQARITNDTNYFGTIAVCEAFLPLMAKGGRVVNVSSRVGLLNKVSNPALQQQLDGTSITVPQLSELVEGFITSAAAGTHVAAGWPDSAYGTSKIAMSAFTRILARDPRWAHLVITAMCPGWCRTDLAGSAAPRSAEEGADTAIFLATDPSVKTSGGFYADRRLISYVTGSAL